MGPGVRALTALAIMLAALPYVAGFFFAPRGAVFLGALNNLGDTGQYLAALRQGAAGQLLYVNQYTSLHATPILMYPLYSLAGLLLAPLRLAPLAAYQLLHLAAAFALAAALWRLCRVLVLESPHLAYALALFGGGLYLPALLLSGLVRLPFAPVALTAPEFSLFAMLLNSPHGALGLAAELWALSGYVLWRRGAARGGLIPLAAGGLALGLCYPFGLVVLLSVVAVHALLCLRPERRSLVTLLAPALTLLPAGAIACYYALLFHSDPLWGGSNMLRLPPPSLAVLLAAYGPLLVLALPAALLCVQAPQSRSMRVGRSRRSALETPDFSLLLTWAIVNGLLLLAPLPQSERLLNGWSVALALLAATTLRRFGRAGRRRWVLGLCCSNAALALLYLTVTLHGSNAAYYAPASEMAAVNWLAQHTDGNDVVMASAGSGNLIVSAARCRVVVGQNFETFHWAAAQRDVRRFYSSTTSPSERAAILRRQDVTLVLAGPYEQSLGYYIPTGRGYRLLYHAGRVRIFAVARR